MGSPIGSLAATPDVALCIAMLRRVISWPADRNILTGLLFRLVDWALLHSLLAPRALGLRL